MFIIKLLGHYGFVEFRTPEETTNGFALNNVAIFGQVGFFLFWEKKIIKILNLWFIFMIFFFNSVKT